MSRALVAILFVAVALIGFSALAFADTPVRQAASAPQRTTTDMSSPTTLDPDDDNVAEELTYPWQDKTFSNDERRQIGYIVVFLCAAACTVSVRRTLRMRRYAAFGTQDRTQK